MTERALPLAGVAVVETSGHVAGPYAGCLLGDLGADVIKVELPGQGDTHRGRNPKHPQYSPSFRALNRNKQSLSLNLGAEEGRAILRDLLATADVFLENFRPATRRRLGLGYELLSAANPRLVHCSISGFGQSGPYQDRPGFDTLAQALSGMLSLMTDVDHPVPVGVSVADHVTGVFAAYGVLAALFAREREGRGRHIDASLLRSSLSFIESHVADLLNGGEAVSRQNFAAGRIFSLKGSDGLALIVHLGGHEEGWRALVSALERRDLLDDPRFATWRQRHERHAEIEAALNAAAGARPRGHWLAALAALGVPSAPVYSLEEAFEDPQVRHLGIPQTVTHPQMGPTRLVGEAVRFSDSPTGIRAPAPLLGEQNDEILERLGYDREARESLKSRGVI